MPTGRRRRDRVEPRLAPMSSPWHPAAVTVTLRWPVVLLLLAAPAWAAAVAPWLAGWHWTLDLLACFPVQAMGALLLLGLGLLLARAPRRAAAVLLGALLSASHVVPPWWQAPPAPAHAGQPVRVLALNLLRGAHGHAPTAVAMIRGLDPDVLFCSELTPEWLQGLAPAVPQLPHRKVLPSAGYFGVGLFSRWPLPTATVLPLGYEWAPAVRAVIATPGGELGLLGVHTPRPGGRQRSAERDTALRAMPAALAGLPRHQVVVGDHNVTPWNHAFGELVESTGLVAASATDWLPSWPAALPLPLRIPIDHALVSPNLGVARVELGHDFGSDHLPLRIDLVLPPP